MTTAHLAASADLPGWAVALTVLLAVVNTALLVVELRRREGRAGRIAVTGLLATAALALAVLRPVRVAARETVVGARVDVLADASRSMALPDGAGRTREDARGDALRKLGERTRDARATLLGFGDGAPRPLALDAPAGTGGRAGRSDLAAALRALETSVDERPRAVVVVSDGRLDDPPEGASAAALATLVKGLGVPIHTVATTHEAPKDASIRRVGTAGAAVAHVPFAIHVEVGCSGGLDCDAVQVSARELREDGPPALLASGVVRARGGAGSVDLTIALDRAGDRILEVALAAPPGDTIPENDRRFLTFHVARERVRVLHVAGRPTNDVRALREWLKSDASVDVVAFFILRTPTDDPHADTGDLALIPFPVDELFTEDLGSFDAVVLQDFDAQPYGLEKHLPALARYVRDGGGLIMVGGPNSFVGGGYADSPLGNATGVLPVRLNGAQSATASDVSPFDPSWTEQGRLAPLLAPLRAVVGDELPSMPGANVLGDARSNAVVLWTHPTRRTPNGMPMPILAIGEEGDGRTIALGVDGLWRLAFSALGTRTSGRGYGALWDGLLGWLMRDPRFEPAQIEVPGGCEARVPVTLRVRVLPDPSAGPGDKVTLDVTPLSSESAPGRRAASAHREAAYDPSGVTEMTLPPLPPGGYVARLRVGARGTTRHEFACEVGGDEWADSRPDPERLRAIAAASGGVFAWADDDLSKLPLPKPTTVSTERHVAPVAPPWTWTLVATVLLGAHWIARRRGGLT